MMKLFSCIFLLSVFLSIFHGSQAKDLINNVCTRVIRHSKDVTYDSCKSTLQSIPFHDRKTIENLGLEMINLIAMNFWETKEEIIERPDETKNQNVYIERILDKCYIDYSEAISLLMDDAVESFRHKRYHEVKVKVIETLTKAKACSDAFKGRRLVSPVKLRYEDIRKCCEITVDVIAMVG